MESYISCIKIRGTPILPPLMTDDRRMEMNYYKKLALAVEEKLMKLRESENATSKKFNKESLIDDEISDIQTEVDQQSNATTIAFICDTNDYCENELSSESTDVGCKATSDDETITKSTDINKFINISDSSKTDITETMSDSAKPSVPKTLDIIPITVEASNIPKSNDSSEKEDSEEEIPKLVRQNSYTVDTPSPLLLAHLVEHSSENYTPTPTTNEAKRKEWTINDNKGEWNFQKTIQNSRTHRHLIEKKISRTITRNSISEGEDNNIRNKFTQRKIEKPTNARRHVKSADCIPTIFSKEYLYKFSKDNTKNIQVEKQQSVNNYENVKNQKLQNNENGLNINLADKFGSSLSAFSNQDSISSKQSSRVGNIRISQSFDASSISKCNSPQSPDRLKPVIQSDKLIQVFTEIQKTHEFQMADLMARQQKEQLIMQQEFQKQQLMLISKIEESFPGVSLPLIVKKTTPSSNDGKFKRKKYAFHNSISLSRSERNRSDPETSPVIGSSFESDESISINFNTSMQKCPDAELHMNHERSKSNVSRELFPLESNTTHVPITNGFICDDRHVKAATIINAYARGYFVRRLMKTERVITLKNIYKEALHCMLKLHIDAPLKLPELHFHKRLQHQCDAASMSIVELLSRSPKERIEIITQDRQIKKSRQERPSSARSSYSFATQRTLARKKFKEMGIVQMPESSRTACTARTRCQTWTSNSREKRSPGNIYQGIKRSTSAGTVRKPWR